MKKYSYIVSALALCACSNQSLEIKGNLENLSSDKAYVATFDSTLSIVVVDTAIVANGQFSFSVQLSDPECVIVSLDDPSSPQPRVLNMFASNDETIDISGDANDPESIKVVGSKYNDMLVNFQNNVPEMDRMQKLINELQTTGNDIDRRNDLNEEIYNIQLEQLAYVKNTISENSDNALGLFILCNSLKLFSFAEIDSLTNVFERSIVHHKYLGALRQIVENARPEYEAQSRVKVGQIAPDFTLPSIDGSEVSLSSFRGKVVLLDFWASWCQPCRNNNKGLVETYNKFASKGLEIISISVDTKLDAWREAVAADGLKGQLLIDSANIVAATYCVRNIPHGLLIDSDGVIVSTDQPMENLFKNIEELLK